MEDLNLYRIFLRNIHTKIVADTKNREFNLEDGTFELINEDYRLGYRHYNVYRDLVVHNCAPNENLKSHINYCIILLKPNDEELNKAQEEMKKPSGEQDVTFMKKFFENTNPASNDFVGLQLTLTNMLNQVFFENENVAFDFNSVVITKELYSASNFVDRISLDACFEEFRRQ